MKRITVGIDGMACEMCEAHIKDVIRKRFDPKKVTASHKSGEAVILTEGEISEAELRQAIDPTGYTVTSVKTEPYEKKRGLLGLFSS